MSENENETSDDNQVGISDDKLPADLVPGDDNPLAGDLDDDASVEDLLTEGKDAVEMDSEDADDASEDEATEGDTSQDG